MPDIVIDTKSLKKLESELKNFPKLLPSAMSAAVNRTLSTVNTRMQKEITSTYNIKKGDLTGNTKFKGERSASPIKIVKAVTARPTGMIDIRSSRFTLSRFLQTPKVPVSHAGMTMKQIKKIRPPTVKVYRTTKKPVNTSQGAFVARGRGGALGIFTRQRDNKKTMNMLRTVSVTQMVGNKKVVDVIQETANKTLAERIDHEVQYRLDKMAGRVK